jgi:hypothetical protein
MMAEDDHSHPRRPCCHLVFHQFPALALLQDEGKTYMPDRLCLGLQYASLTDINSKSE